MKNTLIFSVVFSCFLLFSSCSSAEDDSELQVQIQGKWLYKGLTFNGDYEQSPVEAGDTFYDFKAGGALVVIDEGGSISGSYQVNENNLTLRIDGETEIFTITKLTNSELDLFGMGDVDEEEGLDEVTFHLSRN